MRNYSISRESGKSLNLPSYNEFDTEIKQYLIIFEDDNFYLCFKANEDTKCENCFDDWNLCVQCPRWKIHRVNNIDSHHLIYRNDYKNPSNPYKYDLRYDTVVNVDFIHIISKQEFGYIDAGYIDLSNKYSFTKKEGDREKIIKKYEKLSEKYSKNPLLGNNSVCYRWFNKLNTWKTI